MGVPITFLGANTQAGLGSAITLSPSKRYLVIDWEDIDQAIDSQSAIPDNLEDLVNVSYKINRFIFDLKNGVDEIKEHSKQYDNYFRDLKQLIAILNRRLDYLKHIITLEYPQYFKKKMMKQKQVTRKASSGIFLLFWIDNSGEILPDSLITLDFNPIIKAANLVKNFAICHYQARPKGLRRWGIFYNDDYFSVEKINSSIPYESILLDESNLTFPPNATLVHRNCQLILNQSEATLRSIS